MNPGTIRKFMLRFVGTGALFYLLLVGVFFAFQERLVYFPDRYGEDIEITPQRVGLDFENVSIITNDNETLHAWYVPAEGARQTMLVSHGNAGNLSMLVDTIRMFNSIGLNVLAYDYRGYGKSTGKPDEPGTYNDARAAWNYLVDEHNMTPGQGVIFGRSLGAAVAVQLATEVDEAAVILEAPFTSIMEMAATHYPWMLGRHLATIRYDNASKISDINSALLIIHSREDRVNPFFMGKELFDLARSPRQFLEITGTHGGGYLDNEKIYLAKVKAFLAAADESGETNRL